MPIKKTSQKVDINKRRIINGEDADVVEKRDFEARLVTLHEHRRVSSPENP